MQTETPQTTETKTEITPETTGISVVIAGETATTFLPLAVSRQEKPTKTAKKTKTVKAVAPVEAAPAKTVEYHGGQNGTELTLKADDLNPNEKKVIGAFNKDGVRESKTLAAIAASAYPTRKRAQANSWVRNSLRRLVRAKLVERTARGTYCLTKKGRSAAQH
jgi:hypothetical protein